MVTAIAGALAIGGLAAPAGAEPIVDVGTTFSGRLANSRLELPWLRYRLTMVGMTGARSIGFRLLVLDDALPVARDGAEARAQAATLDKMLQKGGNFTCVTTGAARDGLPLVRCTGAGGDLAAGLVAARLGVARPRVAAVLLPDGFDVAKPAPAPVRSRAKRRPR